MGCDIHHVIEAREPGGPWRAVWPDPVERYDDGTGDIRLPRETPLSLWRNYTLFAALAGVRNYDDLVPIAKPRGMPEDATELFRELHATYGIDAHSCSWVTLGELEAYDWGQPRRPVLTMTGAMQIGTVGHWIGDGWPERFSAELRRFGGPDDVRLVFFFDN